MNIGNVLIAMAAASCLFSCNKSERIESGEPAPDRVRVLVYCPAPGQFVNETEVCRSQAEATAFAQRRLDEGAYVSLGAFGGYLTVAAPRAVENREGYDFGVFGNPIRTSSEPGIVWVSEDVDGDGAADDPWYELRGSDPVTRNYSVTYERTETPGPVAWTDSAGDRGTVDYLPQYHAQNYYPAWIGAERYTLSGSRLTADVGFEAGVWQCRPYGWGYVDNMGADLALDERTNSRYNRFDLDHAVDAAGNPVALSRIHFIRVQCAVQANVPAIGEVSTEVCGFKFFDR